MHFYHVALNIVPPNACVENYRNKNFVISYLRLSLLSPLSSERRESITNFYSWNQSIWMREMSFTKLKDISYNLCKALYIPLWMNHSRTLNNRINVLHKRALSLVYNDLSSSFSELLKDGKSVTIHHRNLQTLAYEIFKVKNNMAPEILTEIFPQK